jgi:transcriptional regulator of acetoin/glycerol metabolism
LSPWEIRVPALRERRADLLAWLERMHREWHDKRDRSDVGPLTHEADAVERLLLHDWPDNLRGIDRLIHRAMSEPGGTLDVRHQSSPASVDSSARSSDGDTDDRLERVARPKRRAKPTKEELTRALDENDGSVRATAKHYGRDRRQIYRWMEQFGLRDNGEG